MSDTACEVIATYNALAVIGEYDCYQSGVLTNDINKFFRLSAEFQLNAMYIINGGWFGSDTSKIGDCLSVYNRAYEVYNEDELKMFDAYLRNKKANGAIVSYDNFGLLKLRIHTFYCYYDAVKNKCIDFNLWGNETAEDLCEESSIEEALNKINKNKGTRKFRIGYILI